jgi:hypothetical protein
MPEPHSAFDLVAALTCELLGAASLAALSTCSKSMCSVARKDHLWPSHFPEAQDLGLVKGFRECSRMARLWRSTADSRMARLWRSTADTSGHLECPGIDAYSLALTFKVKGVRVAGGLFDLSVEEPSHDYDDEKIVAALGSILPPNSLNMEYERDFSVSVFVQRKTDQKYLPLITDGDGEVEQMEEDAVTFESYESSRDKTRAVMIMLLVSTPVYLNDDYLCGFKEARAALQLDEYMYEDASDDDETSSRTLPVAEILQCWHRSRSWV